MNKPECNFDDWWHRKGQFIDPDTADVSWEDKRRALAEAAFDAALAQSGNYVANDDTDPTYVAFANGRIVRLSEATEGPFLTVT